MTLLSYLTQFPRYVYLSLFPMLIRIKSTLLERTSTKRGLNSNSEICLYQSKITIQNSIYVFLQFLSTLKCLFAAVTRETCIGKLVKTGIIVVEWSPWTWLNSTCFYCLLSTLPINIINRLSIVTVTVIVCEGEM